MRISDALHFGFSRTLPVLLGLAGLLGVAIAPVGAEPGSITAFFKENPRYEVLPPPYFESECSDASYLDVELRPYSFLPRQAAWYAEIDIGTVQRVPATGTSTAKTWKGFLPLGDRPVSHAELRVFQQDHQGAHLVSRVTLPEVRKTRFTSHYQRGPRGKQVAQAWGEDGAWMVLIQSRYAPEFWRVPEPVVYVGGDFLYQRIEGLVRYLRTHGVNVWGFKPDFSRDADESLLEMTQNDWPLMRRFLTRIDDRRPAHLVGLCLGGIHARGLAHLEHQTPGPRPLIASVTSVGAPHWGSELADLYNAVELVPQIHRLMTGDPNVHKYKDARPDMADFNRRIPMTPGVPHLSVILNAHRVGIDRRYLESDWVMRVMKAQELGVSPDQVETDGLILVEGQQYGEVAARWETDHAGMINDGRSSTHFDAYRAHLALVEQLHRLHPPRPATP